MMSSLSEAYEECRILNKHYGTLFFHAVNFFPKDVQPHIHSVLAFDRIVKEIIHRPKNGVKKHEQMHALQNWEEAFQSGLDLSYAANPYLRATIHSCKMRNLPPKPFLRVIALRLKHPLVRSYTSDTTFRRSLDSLANNLSEILALLLGYSKQQTKILQRLLANGELLELVCNTAQTQPLAPICHFPKTTLKKFGYTVTEWKNHVVNNRWRELLEYYLITMENEVARLQEQVASFPDSSRAALQITAETYLSLIDDIRQKDYDLFTRQPSLPLSLKIKQYLPALGSLVR